MASAENKLTLPTEVVGEIVEEVSPEVQALRNGGTVPPGARTSDYYRTYNIPGRFDNPDCFEGYDIKPQNPMYRTTNMTYGAKPPSVHTMPTSFHARTQKFSEPLGKCGMYRNQGLNTGKDVSLV